MLEPETHCCICGTVYLVADVDSQLCSSCLANYEAVYDKHGNRIGLAVKGWSDAQKKKTGVKCPVCVKNARLGVTVSKCFYCKEEFTNGQTQCN